MIIGVIAKINPDIEKNTGMGTNDYRWLCRLRYAISRMHKGLIMFGSAVLGLKVLLCVKPLIVKK